MAVVVATIYHLQTQGWIEENPAASDLIFGKDKSQVGGWIIGFSRIYLIVNSYVPLDLLAGLEILKMAFTPKLENDTEMMVVDTTLKQPMGLKANTLDLAEELAQVEYIFCDKTGTLTQNELVFRSLILQNGSKFMFTDDGNKVSDMRQVLDQAQLSDHDTMHLKNFFRCVNLCQDCITIENDKAPKGLTFNGPSVDEVCLLDMTRDSGISFFKERDSDYVTIEHYGEVQRYFIYKIFEFDSDRKCMSVVLKHPTEANKALCFVKGADSSVFPLFIGYQDSLVGKQNLVNPTIKKVEDQVEAMAAKGLRTLLYGMKEIDWP